MSDETERAIQEGAVAKGILDNPLVHRAFTEIEQAYFRAWSESPARDAEGRERVWAMVTGLRKFRAHLESVVQNGVLARAHVDEIERGRVSPASRILDYVAPLRADD